MSDYSITDHMVPHDLHETLDSISKDKYIQSSSLFSLILK